ncbi:hypothetical protein VNI00_007891 [Paramarasmius palmivorus]|uniref:Uncharacterized protein n=1 Tax=Paramarasmius palmivorus TaxID=297713 RepID=A0AAW0CZ83_9AGAR
MKFSANTASYCRLSQPSTSSNHNAPPRKRKPTTSLGTGNAIVGRKPDLEWRMHGRKRIMNKIARQPSIRDSASASTSPIAQPTSQPKISRQPLSTITEDLVCPDPIGPSNDSQKDLEYLHKLMQFVSPVKRDRKAAQLHRTESLSRLSDQAKTKVSATQVLEWSANLSDTQRAAFLARLDTTPRVPIGHPIPRLHLSMLGKPLISGGGSFYIQGEEGYERYTSSSAAKERYLKAIREETRWEGEAKLAQKKEIQERLRSEEEEAKARQLAEEVERRKGAEREAVRLRRKREEKQEAERQRVILEENQRRQRILADREQKRKEKQVEEERRERVRIETMEAQKNPFDLYDLKWAVIRGEKKDYDIPSELSFRQLPWPALFNVDKPEQLSYNDVENFVLSDARRGVWLGKSWKERIKLERLRWHPDRFCAKVLPFVQDCDREATLQGANRVTGYLTSIRERMEARTR